MVPQRIKGPDEAEIHGRPSTETLGLGPPPGRLRTRTVRAPFAPIFCSPASQKQSEIPAVSPATIHTLAVVGSLHRASVTRTVACALQRRLESAGGSVDLLDLLAEPLPLYNPDQAREWPGFGPLKERVDRANVFILGTPDYHGGISSALKNFLDYFWHEFAGKLFVTLVASHEKGLTVTDQLRTVARQCNAWSLPYGISVNENSDVKAGEIINEKLQERLSMAVRDAVVYGALLARQRMADLDEGTNGFMSRHQKK